MQFVTHAISCEHIGAVHQHHWVIGEERLILIAFHEIENEITENIWPINFVFLVMVAGRSVLPNFGFPEPGVIFSLGVHTVCPKTILVETELLRMVGGFPKVGELPFTGGTGRIVALFHQLSKHGKLGVERAVLCQWIPDSRSHLVVVRV
ncbi:MAG: hypothetical protein ACI8XO_000580 [Verrucomicrobiales bacterium]|jgi:hypothetical protein